MTMPFSYGIPLGLILAVAGAILFFATRYKRAAKVVLGVGVAITIVVIILIVVAANSPM